MSWWGAAGKDLPGSSRQGPPWEQQARTSLHPAACVAPLLACLLSPEPSSSTPSVLAPPPVAWPLQFGVSAGLAKERELNEELDAKTAEVEEEVAEIGGELGALQVRQRGGKEQGLGPNIAPPHGAS